MPIGKNSIKRVSAKPKEAKTEEKKEVSSTTLANPAPEVINLVTATAKKPAAKRACAPKATAKKPTAKKATEPKKTEITPTAQNKKDGFIKLSLGDELPTYLL